MAFQPSQEEEIPTEYLPEDHQLSENLKKAWPSLSPNYPKRRNKVKFNVAKKEKSEKKKNGWSLKSQKPSLITGESSTNQQIQRDASSSDLSKSAEPVPANVFSPIVSRQILDKRQGQVGRWDPNSKDQSALAGDSIEILPGNYELLIS